MNAANFTVPFEIPDINHGLKKAQGLISLTNEGFALEFETEDSFVGMFKSGVQNVRINYSDLEEIQYKKGWLSDKIVLEAKSMQTFGDIPGTEVATSTLKVKRKNREEGQNLISQARMHFSEYRLSQMEGDN